MNRRQRVVILAVGLLLLIAVLVVVPSTAIAQDETQQQQIQHLKARLAPLLKFSIDDLQAALLLQVWDTYAGAEIYSDEDRPKFLGVIADEYNEESIFNEYGSYGSEYSGDCIWNEYGTYGGEYSTYSPFNPFTSTPPLIIKNRKTIGRLTVNKSLAGAVNPNWLRLYFTE